MMSYTVSISQFTFLQKRIKMSKKKKKNNDFRNACRRSSIHHSRPLLDWVISHPKVISTVTIFAKLKLEEGLLLFVNSQKLEKLHEIMG